MASETAPEEFEAGVHFLRSRAPAAALVAFDRAEALGYPPVECAAQRWTCWMLLGEFERAWGESDYIAARGPADPHALWDGRPFDGQRVIIRCLHGYGDAIQFLRYAEVMRRTASRVIVETHPEMVTLVQHIRGVDEAITWAGGSLPREHWDRQIEVTELPRAFRTTRGTIPAAVPYIVPDEETQRRSQERFGPARGLRVGLMWASSAWNRARCMPLEELLPLFGVPAWSFYSFQRGPEQAELKQLPMTFPIHDTSVHSPAILDTAADLMHMDLLISVDTMAAHLAGALGRTVWTLLPFEADWRWMEGETTPWYPTMRLFRQDSPGKWEPVIARVVEALRAGSAQGSILPPVRSITEPVTYVASDEARNT